MRYYTSKHYRRLGLRRTDSPKDPTVRRNYPPGIHGPKRQSRKTEYGLQLAEKQKAKVLYNILEKQFRNYFEQAMRKRGDTGAILLELLERRLDNVIYRAGFALSRPQARQMVNHGFFQINGKTVDIASYQISAKEVITVKESKLKAKNFAELEARLEKQPIATWLAVDGKNKKITVTSLPTADEAEQAFNPRLIVEFYSR